jgi:hypothetical protein
MMQERHGIIFVISPMKDASKFEQDQNVAGDGAGKLSERFLFLRVILKE